MKKTGYLGPQGTFSEKAARWQMENYGESDMELIPCRTIPAAFQSLTQGEVARIVVPVENSIEGTVNITLDLMYLHPEFTIMREIIFDINHCLVTNVDDLSEIGEIFSHPQALAQCKKYLDENFPGIKLRSMESTAEATILAARTPFSAAVASEEAAAKYGLKVFARGIQDFRANVTCFWLIGQNPSKKTGRDKTSIVFALAENRPGGLYEVLGILATADIDLTKIQSRPTKKEFGEYLFHIDLKGHRDDKHVKVALEKLKKECSLFRILGAYPQGGN